MEIELFAEEDVLVDKIDQRRITRDRGLPGGSCLVQVMPLLGQKRLFEPCPISVRSTPERRHSGDRDRGRLRATSRSRPIRCDSALHHSEADLLSTGWNCRMRTSERSLSRKKLSRVRITATIASRTSSSQLGAIDVARISAASWKVSPATNQRA
jgi:hypothetical protein